MRTYTVMGVGYSTPKGLIEHVEAYGISEDQIKNVKSIAIYSVNDDGSYTGPATGATNPSIAPAPKDKATNNTNTQVAGCNFNVLPALNTRAPFFETLMKSALYECYSFEVNIGGLSSPLALGLTLLNVKLLNS